MTLAERASPPPYILLLLLLGFIAMFAASFLSFMERPTTTKPGSPNAKSSAESVSTTPGTIASLPDGGADLALTEQQADALTSLMRKLQTEPNNADVLTELGESFLMAKEWSRAEAFLNRAMMNRPADIRPRYMLGICLYQQEKMDDAAKTFEELLEIKADPAAMYNLAVIYKYHSGEKEKAATLLNRVVSSPDADVDTVNLAKKELQAE